MCYVRAFAHQNRHRKQRHKSSWGSLGFLSSRISTQNIHVFFCWGSLGFLSSRIYTQNIHVFFCNKNPSKCRCFDDHFFIKKNDELLMGFCWKVFASGVLNFLLSILRTKVRLLFYYYVE